MTDQATRSGEPAADQPSGGTLAGRPPSRGHRPGIALALIVTFTVMVALDATIVNVALPKIQDGLKFSPTTLSWVINTYVLAFGGLLMAGGRAGDILGRRRMLIWGTALFTLASFVGGFATTGSWLLVTRAVQGIGAAIAMPSTLALVVTNFAEGKERARALSIYSAMAGAGASLGVVLGGILTSWASWRAVMFVNVPVGLVVAFLAPRYIREPERHPGRIDYVGTLTSTLAVVSLVYAFIRVPTDGWSDPVTLATLIAAVVLLGVFLAVEMRISDPMVPLRLFANRNRSAGYFNTLVMIATSIGVFYFATQFLQKVHGFSPLKAGLAFLPMTLGLFATTRVMPKIVARFGTKPCMMAGTLLASLAVLWLSRVSTSDSYLSGVLGPTLLVGIGIGCNFLPMTMTIVAGVAPQDSGSASGTMQAMQQIGSALGLAIAVTVFGTASRHAAEHPAGATAQERARDVLVHGVQNAFVTCSIFAGLAFLVALLVIRARPAQARAQAGG